MFNFSLLILLSINILNQIFLINLSILSYNKFANISLTRNFTQTFAFDFLNFLIFISLIICTQNFSIYEIFINQNTINYFFILSLISFFLLLNLFLESNRTPIDLIECESEVVAGYNIEFGGGYMLILFITEYAHLLLASIMFLYLFCGGLNTILNSISCYFILILEVLI